MITSMKAYLQILARISPLPVANNWLVGLGATEITVPKVRKDISHRLILLTGVLVPLKHHLCVSGDGIPELDTSVLGPTHNPLSVWCKAHTENKVLFIMFVSVLA